MTSGNPTMLKVYEFNSDIFFYIDISYRKRELWPVVTSRVSEHVYFPIYRYLISVPGYLVLFLCISFILCQPDKTFVTLHIIR